MKAARYYGNHDIRIEDIEPQTLEPGTVRIDVAWCGICGTDLHEYLDGPIFCPTCDTPHPISGETAPVTLGHEFSGVISEVGEGIDDLAVGDHVVVEPYIVRDDVDTSEANDTYHLSEDMNFIVWRDAAADSRRTSSCVAAGSTRSTRPSRSTRLPSSSRCPSATTP